MIRGSLAVLLLFAAACTPPAPEAPATDQTAVGPAPRNADEATAQDTCGAAVYASYIGRPSSELDVRHGARVIAPDTVVTDDFVSERINFIVNAEGVVTDIRCY